MEPSPMDMGGPMPPMPPMGGPTSNGVDGGGQMPPMGDEKSYDADFDAGVDTEEEDDPKKFIQQLTGKLSQSLNKYQGSLPEPDVELNKYVASMTIAAATKGLDEKEVNSIYKKLKDKGDDNETDEDMDSDTEGEPMDNGGSDMQTESKEFTIDKLVNEVCREVLQTKDCVLDNNKRNKGKFNPYSIPKQFSRR